MRVDDEGGGFGVHGAAVAAVGGAGGGELGAGGRVVHHDATCVAAADTAGVVREVGGAVGGVVRLHNVTVVTLGEFSSLGRVHLVGWGAGFARGLRAPQPVLHFGRVPALLVCGVGGMDGRGAGGGVGGMAGSR